MAQSQIVGFQAQWPMKGGSWEPSALTREEASCGAGEGQY